MIAQSPGLPSKGQPLSVAPSPQGQTFAPQSLAPQVYDVPITVRVHIRPEIQTYAPQPQAYAQPQASQGGCYGGSYSGGFSASYQQSYAAPVVMGCPGGFCGASVRNHVKIKNKSAGQRSWRRLAGAQLVRTAMIDLRLGDCLSILPTLEAGSIDAVVTDPPYGIGYNPGDGGSPWTNGVKSFSGRNLITGDNKPFDPSHLLTFRSIILWGANHYADKLPPISSWFIWDKRYDGVSNDFADCEMAWCSLGSPARVFRHVWQGAFRASEAQPAETSSNPKACQAHALVFPPAWPQRRRYGARSLCWLGHHWRSLRACRSQLHRHGNS